MTIDASNQDKPDVAGVPHPVFVTLGKDDQAFLLMMDTLGMVLDVVFEKISSATERGKHAKK